MEDDIPEAKFERHLTSAPEQIAIDPQAAIELRSQFSSDRSIDIAETIETRSRSVATTSRKIPESVDASVDNATKEEITVLVVIGANDR
jgi:hypothetical protein